MATLSLVSLMRSPYAFFSSAFLAALRGIRPQQPRTCCFALVLSKRLMSLTMILVANGAAHRMYKMCMEGQCSMLSSAQEAVTILSSIVLPSQVHCTLVRPTVREPCTA